PGPMTASNDSTPCLMTCRSMSQRMRQAAKGRSGVRKMKRRTRGSNSRPIGRQRKLPRKIPQPRKAESMEVMQTPLEIRIRQIRAEIDGMIDARAEAVARQSPGVPLEVIRNLLTARTPGCRCAQYLALTGEARHGEPVPQPSSP